MLDFGKFADYSLTERVVIICSIVLLVALATVAIIIYVKNNKKDSSRFSTHDITYGAICLSISFVLSFIGVTMPQGGTVTPASSLAVMLFCYFFGFRKGLVVCFAFMLLQFLQSPFILHPMSAVLDYIIPYLSLIFFGIFSCPRGDVENNLTKNLFRRNSQFLIGAVSYMTVRYLSHVVSGIVFYAEHAWKGWDVNAYSFAYNTFFLIDAAIAVIAGVALMSKKSFYRFMLQQTNKTKKDNIERT